MGERAARRFSIGLDDDNVPVFGIANDDVEAVMSVKWSSVAFVRGVQRKDWVVLACKDARVNEPRADDPVALRMWLPTSTGLLDGWIGFTEIETIRFKETTIYKGKPIASSEFLAVLPLAFKGNWEKAAEVPVEVKK
ncbi:hypothetical protein [Thalassospira xiamenensis]|nr:hypothetical protein [Thalassospira xiamenensis]